MLLRANIPLQDVPKREDERDPAKPWLTELHAKKAAQVLRSVKHSTTLSGQWVKSLSASQGAVKDSHHFSS